MAKDYGDDGRWVTINGRRVFIAEGQSLGDAMKKSGKFDKKFTKRKAPDSYIDSKITSKTDKDVIKDLEQRKEQLKSKKDRYTDEEYKKQEKGLNDGIKYAKKGNSNSIPRDYEKITYTQKIESSAGKVGDKFELTKDEYDRPITKNLRTGETYQANLSMLKSKDAVEINDIAKKENLSNSYTRDELKSKYGTDNVDLINAGKESQDRVKLNDKQISEGNRLSTKAENMAKEDVETYLSGKSGYKGSDEDFVRDLADNYSMNNEDAQKIYDEFKKSSNESSKYASAKRIGFGDYNKDDVPVYQNKIDYTGDFSKANLSTLSNEELTQALNKQSELYNKAVNDKLGDQRTRNGRMNKIFNTANKQQYETGMQRLNEEMHTRNLPRYEITNKDNGMVMVSSPTKEMAERQLKEIQEIDKSLQKSYGWKKLPEYELKEGKSKSSSKSMNESIREKAGKTKADRNIDAFDDDNKKESQRRLNAKYDYNTPGKIGNMKTEDFVKQRNEFNAKADKLWNDNKVDSKQKKISDDAKSGKISKKEAYKRIFNLHDDNFKQLNQISKNYDDEVVASKKPIYSERSNVIKRAMARMSDENKAKTRDAREELRKELNESGFGKSIKNAVEENKMFKAWQRYRKSHPNSDISLTSFKQKYKG